MAQKTDLELIAEANVIRDETAIGANTALRIGTMLDNLVDSKINNDRVSDSTSLGNSTTLVPSQNAVKTYVDAFATGLLTDNGNYDPTITSEYPTSGDTLSGGAVQKGDIWYISADGTMNGNAVLIGYSVRALVDNAGATTDASWSISNVGIGFVPENVANKSTDVNLGTSDVYYPSQNAVKTYVDTEVAAAIPFTPENVANKSQDIISNPSSTVLYPSNKAVADYIAFGVDLQAVTDSGNITTNDVHIYNVIDSSNATDSGAAYLNNVVGDGGIVGIKKADGTTGEIKATNLTANRDYELPNTSGTLALLSDIPTSSSWDLIGNAGTTPGTNFIGTTDANDVVFKAGGVEYFKLSIADQLLLLSKSITCNSTSTTEIAVRSTAIPNNGFVAINQNATDKGNILINNGDSTTKITTLASGALRTVSLPNASGTLALTSDIVAPYKSYVVNLGWNGVTWSTTNIYQNTLGGTVTLSNLGGSRMTLSTSGLFTSGKTVVIPSIIAQGQATLIGGLDPSFSTLPNDLVIRWNNASGASAIPVSFSSSAVYILEVRVYP